MMVVPRSSFTRAMNSRIRGLGHHIQAHRRLIQVEQPRVVDHRRGQIPAHPLTERELPNRDVEELRHLQQLHQLGLSSITIDSVDPVQLAHRPKRLAQGQIPPQRTALAEHGADHAGIRSTVAGGIQPGDRDLAGRRRQDAGQHLDRRRLPGPVRSEIADQLTAVDRERDIVHRPDHLRATREERSQPAERPLHSPRSSKLLHQMIGTHQRLAFDDSSSSARITGDRSPTTRSLAADRELARGA